MTDHGVRRSRMAKILRDPGALSWFCLEREFRTRAKRATERGNHESARAFSVRADVAAEKLAALVGEGPAA